MVTIGELDVVIGVDTRELQRGLQQVQGQLRTFDAMSRTAGSGMQQLERSTAKTAQTVRTNLVSAITTLEGPLSRTGAIVTRLAGPAGFAALGSLAVGGLTKLAVSAGNLADVLLDLEQTTSIAVEQLQRFRGVERAAGVPMDTVARSAQRLQERLSRSESTFHQAADAARELGVTLTRDVGRDLPALLAALADMEDVSQRNAAAVRIFGRSWRDLVPVLALGSEAIRATLRNTTTLTREQLEAANRFRAALAQLRGELGTLAAFAGSQLAQGLEDSVGGFDEATSAVSELTQGVIALVKQMDEARTKAPALRRALVDVFTPTGLDQAQHFTRRLIDDLRELGREAAAQREALETNLQFMALIRRAQARDLSPVLPAITVGVRRGLIDDAALQREIDILRNRLQSGLREAAELRVDIQLGRAADDAEDRYSALLDRINETETALIGRLEQAARRAAAAVDELRPIIEGLPLEPFPPIPAPTRGGLEALQRTVGEVTGLAGLEQRLREAERAAELFRLQLEFVTANVFVSFADFGTLLVEASVGLIDFRDALVRGVSSVGSALGGLAGTRLSENLTGALALAAPGIGSAIGSTAGPIIGAALDRALRTGRELTTEQGFIVESANAQRKLQEEIRGLTNLIASVEPALEADDFRQLREQFAIPHFFEVSAAEWAGILDDARDRLERLTETVEEVNDSFSRLLNAPSGFKTTLDRLRFEATTPEIRTPPPIGAPSLPPVGGIATQNNTVNIERGAIVINGEVTGEGLLRAIESAVMNRQSRGGGGLQLAPGNAPVLG